MNECMNEQMNQSVSDQTETRGGTGLQREKRSLNFKSQLKYHHELVDSANNEITSDYSTAIP